MTDSLSKFLLDTVGGADDGEKKKKKKKIEEMLVVSDPKLGKTCPNWCIRSGSVHY